MGFPEESGGRCIAFMGWEFSDFRCQISEARFQIPDVRCQMSGFRCQRSEVRDQEREEMRAMYLPMMSNSRFTFVPASMVLKFVCS